LVMVNTQLSNCEFKRVYPNQIALADCVHHTSKRLLSMHHAVKYGKSMRTVLSTKWIYIKQLIPFRVVCRCSLDGQLR